MIDLTFVDKGIFSKTGYFQVKDRTFTNKVEAFVYASHIGSEVKWNFYDEIKRKIIAQRNNQYDKFCLYFPTVRVES